MINKKSTFSLKDSPQIIFLCSYNILMNFVRQALYRGETSVTLLCVNKVPFTSCYDYNSWHDQSHIESLLHGFKYPPREYNAKGMVKTFLSSFSSDHKNTEALITYEKVDIEDICEQCINHHPDFKRQYNDCSTWFDHPDDLKFFYLWSEWMDIRNAAKEMKKNSSPEPLVIRWEVPEYMINEFPEKDPWEISERAYKEVLV